MTDQEPSPEEVFISYSWDSEEHIADVLQLSNRLRSEGIDCVLDQYEDSPPEGWPRWMDRKIKGAKFVLMVCTENYYKRVMGETPADEGRGVKWEGGLIYQHIYNAGSNNTKFIPVILKSGDSRFIPMPLQGATHYEVNTVAGYDKLYARLLGKQLTMRPRLGPRRPLPKREIKTNFSAFVSAPIDPELWDQARWKGTVFLMYKDKPPVLGLAFLNENSARRIFQQWHQRYGNRDRFEELRISLIEGDIKGEQPGYSVHVGIDIDNSIRRYREAGLTVNPNDMFLTIGRIHRMNPSPGSTFLDMFKEEYRHHKTFTLIPAVISPDATKVKPIFELGIYKSMVHFRRVEDIGPNDEDYSVLNSGAIKRPTSGLSGTRVLEKDPPRKRRKAKKS